MFERTKQNLIKTRIALGRVGAMSLYCIKKLYTIEITALLIIAGTIGITFAIYAAPNQAFVYQGRLTDANYVPVANGTYYVKLKIYSDPAGGSANCVWSTGSVTNASLATITNNCNEALSTSTVQATVTHGSFAIHLGDTGITGGKMPDISNLIFKTTTYYLGVTVCGTGVDAATACAGSPAPAEMTPLLAVRGSVAGASIVSTLQANTFNQVPGSYTQINDTDGITASDATITVDSTAAYLSAGTLLIDTEVITYTGTTTAPNPETFTGLTRGGLGTTAATHADNATVKTYLMSGAANTTTRPIFIITSDGNTFINSNASTIDSQFSFQTSGSTGYSLGIDRVSGSSTFKIRTSSAPLSGTGTILLTSGTTVLGSGTTFRSQLVPGSTITISGQTRTITSIGGDITIFVDSAFSPEITSGTPAFTYTNPLLTLDSRTTTSGVNAALFTGLNSTISPAANASYTTLTITPPQVTFSNGSSTVAAQNAVVINQPTIVGGSGNTITDSATMMIAGPPAPLTSGTFTNTYGLRITTAAAGSATNSYGLAVAASSTATNNYAAQFMGRTGSPTEARVGVGTTAPITQLHVRGNMPNAALRTISTGAGTIWVDVQGRYAYVTNRTANTFEIYDISNPGTSFTGTGTLATSGTTTVTGSGTAFTSQLAVGDTITASGQSRTVTVITDATTLTTNSAFSPNLSSAAFTYVEGKRVSSTATGTAPVQIVVKGRYAYLVNATSNTLQIFDVSNPAVPVSMGTAATNTTPNGIAVQGRYAYVTNNGAATLQIFDVSNPAAPTGIGSVGTGTNPLGIAVQGRFVYITNTVSNTLQIIDVSNPASPQVASTTASADTTGIALQGRYAYVTNLSTNTLQIFDVSNPATPTSISTTTTEASPEGLAVQGRYAFIANNGANTLQIFDISNPVAPAAVGSVSTDTAPIMVTIQGRYAFVPNNTSSTLQIFDIGGSYIQELGVGGLEIASGQVRNDFTINNLLDVRGGVNVGLGGLFSTGPLTATGLNPLSTASALDIRNSAGTNLLYVQNDDKIGLGVIAPSYDLSLSGSASRTIGMEAVAAGNGTFLTLRASNGTGTSVTGGTLVLSSGQSTGTATTKVQIQVSQAGATSNTTGNAPATMFEFTNGHVAAVALGTAPTASCNGNAATLATGSNDTAGRITIPASPGTSCILSFARSFASAPACSALYESAANSSSITVSSSLTSSVTFAFSPAPTAADTFSYFCVGQGSQ